MRDPESLNAISKNQLFRIILLRVRYMLLDYQVNIKLKRCPCSYVVQQSFDWNE